jgi:hypothetical protein
MTKIHLTQKYSSEMAQFINQNSFRILRSTYHDVFPRTDMQSELGLSRDTNNSSFPDSF